MKHKSFLTASFLIILSAQLLACAPTLNTRGNFLEEDQVKSVETGVTTKQEVEQKLGSPTSVDPFDQNTWFYIGETTETEAFFAPKVTSRRVLKVQFDESGTVSNVANIDDKAGKNVDVVKKTTAAGGQEMNAFQQFMGNLGKFNSSQMGQQQPQGR